MVKTSRIGLFLFIVVASGFLSVATAQQSLISADIYAPHGIMPNSDQVSDGLDSINPATGQLNLGIPVGSLKGGRAGMGFNLQLLYDSNLFDFPIAGSGGGDGSGWKLSTSGGWKYSIDGYKLDMDRLPAPSSADMALSCSDWNTQRGLPFRYRLRIGLPDGSLHILHLAQGPASQDLYGSIFYTTTYSDQGFYAVNPAGIPYRPACDFYRYNQILTYYTTDGTHLKLEIPTSSTTPDWTKNTWRLYYPDGRVVTGVNDHANEIYDANGNKIVIERISGTYDGYGSGNFTVLRYDDGSDNKLVIQKAYVQTDTVTRDRVISRGPNGDITYYVDWATVAVDPKGTLVPMVTQVQMPLANVVDIGVTPPAFNSYAFNYHYVAPSDRLNGLLDGVRTPSGAQYNYAYQILYTDSTPYKIQQKTITYDAQATLTWTLQYYGNRFGVSCPTQPDLDNPCTDVTNPDGGISRYYYYKGAGYNYHSAILPYRADGMVYRIDGPSGTVHKRNWKSNAYFGQNKYDLYVSSEATTVGNNNGTAFGQPLKTAITDYNYDANGNLLAKTEYDWVDFAGSSIEMGSVIKRKTIYGNYLVVMDDQNPDGYWQPNDPAIWSQASGRRLTSVQRVTITDGTTPYAATEYTYDNAYTSGNITYEKHWDSVKSPTLPDIGAFSSANAQVLTHTYDSYGNLTDVSEPEVPTHNTYDPLSRHIVNVAKVGQRNVQTTYANDVAIQSVTDVENGLTTSYGYDYAGRQILVTEGISASVPSGLRQTQTIYDDANRKVAVAGDLFALGDGKLQAITHVDQLGRAVLVQKSEGTPLLDDQAGIKVKTTYIQPAGSGKRVIASTPYRSENDATLQWNCTEYDRLGRAIAVAMFKGSSAPTDCESATNRTGITITEYSVDTAGAWTSVTDPAGKKRKMRSDALGHLMEVVEDPDGLNYHATYQYDPLDNLISVTQGAQTRTFIYSSLSRLKDATNPESGTISYLYYDSGDLQTKTDARGITAAITYDGLHRVSTKTYSDSTPAVTYNYHSSSAPNIGQLQSVATSDSTSSFTYDALGRVATSKQTMHTNAGDVDFPFSYAWNLSGSLSQEIYPSGRQVSYSADVAGRTNKVYDATKTYADMSSLDPTLAYAPDGRIARMKLGNNLWATMDYQAPGTPTVYMLGTAVNLGDLLQLEYNFDSTANNGNVMSQNIIRNGVSWHQTFQYDAVNRLLDAIESGGFHQQYGYDQYGNRTVTLSTGLAHDDANELNSVYNPSNNRLVSNQTGSVNYDIAGNQTSYGSFILGYDANGKTKSFTSPSSNGTYAYDGADKRVKKVVTSSTGTTATYYIYDALGRLAAEYSDQPAASSGTSWVFTDMLGSTRAITSQAGSSGYGSVTQCYDYLPFGRMLSSSDNGRGSCHPPNPDDQIDSTIPQKFTGKERDAETGLDYFGARYLSSAQGRWTSPDQPFADQYPENPQSWNLYNYVHNNPLIFIDTSGKKIELKGTDTERTEELNRICQMIGSGLTSSGQVIINIHFGVDDITENGELHHYVKRDPNSNQNIGHFGTMLDSSIIIEFHLSSTYYSKKYPRGRLIKYWGGAITIPGFESLNNNIQIYVDDLSFSYANDWGRIDNGRSSSDRTRLHFYNDIVDAHEFGHAYGYLLGLNKSDLTNVYALQWENWARAKYVGRNIENFRNYRRLHPKGILWY
jgi:RHS repeat-associated protein